MPLFGAVLAYISSTVKISQTRKEKPREFEQVMVTASRLFEGLNLHPHSHKTVTVSFEREQNIFQIHFQYILAHIC